MICISTYPTYIINMQIDILNNFQYKETLSSNETEKRIVVLGTIKQQQGQAILIIAATTPSSPPYLFQSITQIFKNDIYSRYDTLVANKYEIQTIFPITPKHKEKYKQKTMLMQEESAEEYQSTKKQLLEKQLGHIGWVNNIIEGKAEQERVLYRCEQFIVLPDFKFSDLNKSENLHLLCIFTDEKLASLRDLRGQNVQILKNAQNEIEKLLLKKFNMEKGASRMYFHYPPTFYRLHLHITNLRVQALIALADRAHLLQHVISNLQICPDYYTKATLIKMVEKK